MKIVIIGVGTTGMIVADIIAESHNFTLAGFIGTEEEAKKLSRSKIYSDKPFFGEHSILSKLMEEGITGFVSAIGDNTIREEVYYEAKRAGLIPINAISKHAIINSSVILGKGVVISPGVVLSHGVELEDNIIIDPRVVVDVNTKIGSHSYIYPGATICGGCVIEKNVTLGPAAVLEPNVKVGKNQIVPAGNVVAKDLEGLFRKDRQV